ncbi:hypothetical protein BY458DRAFT_496944 [Sporodiniella umbellata]|nr:hypothetical protein BY458DRAFT_496944 [Sporodiniella umbellata]
MTLNKRNGRKSRKKTQSSDEESSESDSVTRCVCGKSHSVGLMVQCDDCEVWQHCSCMGLDEPDIPDQYFCEVCKPENHFTTRLANGKTKQEYSSDGQEKRVPKKRMTLNSREASMSLEDVLAVRSALELYETGKPSPTTSPPSPLTTHHHPNLSPALPTLEEEALPATQERPEASDSEVITIKAPKPKKKKEDKRRTAVTAGRGKVAKRGKPRSRTSTPQLADDAPALDEHASPNSSLEETTNIGTAIFDYFTPQSRASSPPAKTRQPHARMTLYEMNRRAKQILEYISSIQIQMASKGSKEDDLCSLSSASTLPLEPEDDDFFFHQKIKSEQSSMEIMDILTRKLIKFQDKFGTKEEEGRITRSREIL